MSKNEAKVSYAKLTNGALADTYGQIKAEVAEATSREEACKKAIYTRIKRSPTLEGELFRVTCSTFPRKDLNEKKIRDILLRKKLATQKNIDAIIDLFKVTSEVTRVMCTARKRDENN